MHRWKLLAIITLSAVPLALFTACVLVWSVEEKKITWENVFDKAASGMDRTEIESIYGPPGDYSTGPLSRGDDFSAQRHPVDPFEEICLPDGRKLAAWTNDSLRVMILFDQEGKAGPCFLTPVERIEQSSLESLMWRARRHWRRWLTPQSGGGARKY
jgi:hypothetical protein